MSARGHVFGCIHLPARLFAFLVVVAAIHAPIAVHGQTGFVGRYVKVLEYHFSEADADYVQDGEHEVSGAFAIDPFKVFIQGYYQRSDWRLPIISRVEGIDDRDSYECELNNQRVVVALTPDRRFLTLIGLSEKYVFVLK